MRQIILAAVLLIFFAPSHTIFAQQPPPLTPQEQLKRLGVEITYVEREHKLCRQNLADVLARLEAAQGQIQQLQDELKKAKEPADAAPKKK